MTDLVERCADLPRVHLEAGDVVIPQGAAVSPVFVLLDGEVAVERNGTVLARVANRGAVFGEMSALLHCPATATVRAMTAVSLLRADDAEAFLVSQPEITLAVARTLAGRLDRLSGYIAEVKRQYADRTDHFGMLDEVLSALAHDQTPKVRPGSARMPEYDY